MFIGGFEKVAISRGAIVKILADKKKQLEDEAAKLKQKVKATKDTRLRKRIAAQSSVGTEKWNNLVKREKSIIGRMNKEHVGPDLNLSGNWRKAKGSKFKKYLPIAAGAAVLGAGALAYSKMKKRKEA